MTLSANISIQDTGDLLENMELIKSAVRDGILMWEGEYRVFGGQDLRVRIELTWEMRLFDTVRVIPLTKRIKSAVKRLSGPIKAKEAKKRMDDILGQSRSFAVTGMRKWSVGTRKFIYLQSRDGRFEDYEELKYVTKHEFGHILGLGDLYKSERDHLEGVKKGTYAELDGYYISNDFYHLVMCDPRGAVSNNDIEMVVLAFSQNRRQNYQRQKPDDEISEALGKGD